MIFFSNTENRNGREKKKKKICVFSSDTGAANNNTGTQWCGQQCIDNWCRVNSTITLFNGLRLRRWANKVLTLLLGKAGWMSFLSVDLFTQMVFKALQRTDASVLFCKDLELVYPHNVTLLFVFHVNKYNPSEYDWTTVRHQQVITDLFFPLLKILTWVV